MEEHRAKSWACWWRDHTQHHQPVIRENIRIWPNAIRRRCPQYASAANLQLHLSLSSPTMASALLRRQLAISASASRFATRRCLSTSSSLHQETEKDQLKSPYMRHAFDTHIVEDLLGRSAHEILAETGHRKESTMRHFTGQLSCFEYSRISSLKRMWVRR